jgi:hypothetical protein
MMWWACPLCDEIQEYDVRGDGGAWIGLEVAVIPKHWHVVGLVKLGLGSERAARAYIENNRAAAQQANSIREQAAELRRQLHELYRETYK